MLFVNTGKIKYSTVGASFTVTYAVAPDEINSLMILHASFAEHNGKAYPLKESEVGQTEGGDEYEDVIKAVDIIRAFLDTHEKNSTTCLWESDIDGTILKTDWGYFEEGLDEIRDYCERLDADRKTENNSEKPNSCDTCANGEGDVEACGYCRHGDLYEPKDEPQTDCPWK